MQIHTYTQASEGDALGFETESLFERHFSAEQNFASGADHTMPGQPA